MPPKKTKLLQLRRHFQSPKVFDSGRWRFVQVPSEGKAPSSANAVERGEGVTEALISETLGMFKGQFPKELRRTITCALSWFRRQLENVDARPSYVDKVVLKALTSCVERTAPEVWNAVIELYNRFQREMSVLQRFYNREWDKELKSDDEDSSDEDEEEEWPELAGDDGDPRDIYAEKDEAKELKMEGQVIDDNDEDDSDEELDEEKRAERRARESVAEVEDPEQEEEGDEDDDDEDEDEDEDEGDDESESEDKEKQSPKESRKRQSEESAKEEPNAKRARTHE